MRALVYDSTLFVNDESTPPRVTWRPATLIRLYPDRMRLVVDVVFDHRPAVVSHAHFFEQIKYLEEDSNELYRKSK